MTPDPTPKSQRARLDELLAQTGNMSFDDGREEGLREALAAVGSISAHSCCDCVDAGREQAGDSIRALSSED